MMTSRRLSTRRRWKQTYRHARLHGDFQEAIFKGRLCVPFLRSLAIERRGWKGIADSSRVRKGRLTWLSFPLVLALPRTLAVRVFSPSESGEHEGTHRRPNIASIQEMSVDARRINLAQMFRVFHCAWSLTTTTVPSHLLFPPCRRWHARTPDDVVVAVPDDPRSDKTAASQTPRT